jgi:hypothetical protein
MSSNWIFEGKEVNSIDDTPLDALGFIYKITNTENGMWYIGKKQLDKAATKVVKGKKKKIRKESDWKEYWSSSPYLKELILKDGTDNFKREIIMFAFTKASLTYSEEFCLFKTGALFDPLCYNGNIRAKIMRSWFNKTPDLHVKLCNLAIWNNTPEIG